VCHKRTIDSSAVGVSIGTCLEFENAKEHPDFILTGPEWPAALGLRHPSLSRPPIDHVHGPLHGLDAEPLQKLLEGLAFHASRIKRRQTAAMPITRPLAMVCGQKI
jgi:hypothetical protein